jgi:hypothetical protein
VKRLIVTGDVDVRKDGRIAYDGTEYVCFSVTRNGDWHGPSEPQSWCVIGTPDEREAFERRDYVPHFLDTEAADADEVEVLQRAGDRAV